jgi:ParB/RepB/Spo0J family partition protein
MIGKCELAEGIGASPADSVKTKIRTEILFLNPDQIERDSDQPRQTFDKEGLARLAQSLRKIGQLQPVIVRHEQDRYILVTGERRWRAAKMAGKPYVEAVLWKKGDVRSLQLVENLLREDLKPIEHARAYVEIMQREKWSARELARRLSIDHSRIAKALKLLDLPEKVQKAVDAGKIPPTTAYEIAKRPSAEQEWIAREAAAGRIKGTDLRRREPGPAPVLTLGAPPRGSTRPARSRSQSPDTEATLREVERGRLDPRRFMDEIARYTGEVIRAGDAAPVDAGRLGDCPRCGRPVIAGKRGFGCSGWREGCRFVLWREYEGHPLGDDQVRELLQHRVLRSPVTLAGSGEVVLRLTDSGGLVHIPVPTGGQRRPAGGGTGPRTRRRGAAGGGPERGRPGRRAIGFAAIALGPCPLCKSGVMEGAKSYGCSARQRGCKFAIGKTIAGKRITVRTAQALLKQGRSPVLKGFASKSGKSFDARLKLDGGEVRFEFGP